MKKFLLTLFILFLTASVGFCATNSYNKYGQRTGSYKQSGSTINHYNQYGQKTGSYKQTAKTF